MQHTLPIPINNVALAARVVSWLLIARTGMTLRYASVDTSASKSGETTQGLR